VLEGAGGRFDAAVVSLPLVTGLATLDGVPRELLRSLLARTSPGGVSAVCGIDLASGDPEAEIEGLAEDLGPEAPALALYRPVAGRSPLLLSDEAAGGGVLLAGVEPWETWPPELKGLVPVCAREGERRPAGEKIAPGESLP